MIRAPIQRRGFTSSLRINFDNTRTSTYVKPINFKNISSNYFSNKIISKLSIFFEKIINNVFFTNTSFEKNEEIKIKKISIFDKRINDLWNHISKKYKNILIKNS